MKIIQLGLIDIVEAIADAIKRNKSLIGDINNLPTIDKTDIVSAISELQQNILNLESPINDSLTSPKFTWSSTYIVDQLDKLKSEITKQISNISTFDELKEELLHQVGNYVRWDIDQQLEVDKQAIARSNINSPIKDLSDSVPAESFKVQITEQNFTTVLKDKLESIKLSTGTFA